MVFKSPKHVTVKFALKEEKPQSVVGIVIDYIFRDEYEESNISWLLRVADRYENDSSYTSISDDLAVEDMASGKYNLVIGDSLGLDLSPACNKNYCFEANRDDDGWASLDPTEEVRSNVNPKNSTRQGLLSGGSSSSTDQKSTSTMSSLP